MGRAQGVSGEPMDLAGFRLEKIAKRDRRPLPDEERTLLDVAAPRLYRLIVAAVETGCPLGELLSLQWEDVDLTRGEIRTQARHAKQRKLRHIPIVARLRAVIDMPPTTPPASGSARTPMCSETRWGVGKRPSSKRTGIPRHGETGTLLYIARGASYDRLALPRPATRSRVALVGAGVAAPSRQGTLLGHASNATTDTDLNASRLYLRESMLAMERRGKNGTHVAQPAKKQHDHSDQSRRSHSRNSILH